MVKIIAELGINHNGKLEYAKRLVDSAVEAGCDLVKIQMYKTSHLYSKSAGKIKWRAKDKQYKYDIYKANLHNQVSFGWVSQLRDYCKKNKIGFCASVWDIPSTKELMKFRPLLIKIGSAHIVNIPLFRYIAKLKRPVYFSIGGANLSEIDEAYHILEQGRYPPTILHCHLNYPTPPESANLNVIKVLKMLYPRAVVGYSDHTLHPYYAPVTAVKLGAEVIEKHITLDKNMTGPDHFFALEPKELALMVKKVREAEQGKGKINRAYLGSGEIGTDTDELRLRNFTYPTIMTTKHIHRGDKFTRRNLKILRPGNAKRGLDPKYFNVVLGRFANQDIPFGRPIQWSYF